MRGEFIRGDGLVIPNNITNLGVESILKKALRGDAFTLFMGLCNCAPNPELRQEDLNEPGLGFGYARIAVETTNIGWPMQGTINGEVFFESQACVFAPAQPWIPVSRPYFSISQTDIVGRKVFSLGATLPNTVILTPTTPVAERTFKYRIYGR